jgi:hypothetical protein
MSNSDSSIPDTTPPSPEFNPSSSESILDLANYEEPAPYVDREAAQYQKSIANKQKQWAKDDSARNKRRIKEIVNTPGYVQVNINTDELEWCIEQALDTVLPYAKIVQQAKVKFGRTDKWVSKLYKFTDKQRMKAILRDLGKTNNTGKILVKCDYMSGSEGLSRASTGALRNVMNNIQYEKKREHRLRTLEKRASVHTSEIAGLKARL